MFNVHSPFSNASFQIKDNKRKMGPALPILQNLDCVDQIWIKINHPSLVSSNIFVPLVKIGFFVRQYHSCTFSFKLVLYYSSSFIQESKYPNTFHYRILCSIVFTFSVKIPIFPDQRGNILMISEWDLWNVIRDLWLAAVVTTPSPLYCLVPAHPTANTWDNWHL